MMTLGILPRRSTGWFAAAPHRDPRSRHCPVLGVFASRTPLAPPAKRCHGGAFEEAARVTSDSSIAPPYDRPAPLPKATASSLAGSRKEGSGTCLPPAFRQRASEEAPLITFMVRGVGIEPTLRCRDRL